MGYRIEYGIEPKRFAKNDIKWTRLAAISAAFLLFFGFLTMKFWPEGRAKLEEVLLPGDPAVTKQAFAAMTEQLRAGEAIGDAVVAFCREVVDGAALAD